MTYYTKAEMLKSLRKDARGQGLTFKEQNAYINGLQAYTFVDRQTKEVVSKNHTLQSAFDAQEVSRFICELKYIS